MRTIGIMLFCWMLSVSGSAGAERIALPKAGLKRVQVTPSVERTWVIAVGVGSYLDAFWPSLKWAGRDAERMSAALGVGVDQSFQKIVLLDGAATLQAVQNAFARVAAQAGVRDSLIVYFSGHGTLERNAAGLLEPYLVLHGTRSESIISTGFSRNELRRLLEKLPTRRHVVILAACHSGVGKSRLSPEVASLVGQAKGVLPPLQEVSEGTIELAAAARGETALEHDGLKGDVYTHFFLEALDVFDRNGDGAVSVMEAHDFARDRTWSFTQGRQRPTAELRAIGDVDFSLRGSRNNAGRPVLESYSVAYEDFSLSVNRSEKGRLPNAFVLQDGNNRVEVFSANADRRLAVYEFAVKSGERVAFSELLRPYRYWVSFGIGLSSYLNDATAKLTGEPIVNGMAFALGFRRWDWSIGLSLFNPEFKEVEVLPGVLGRVGEKHWLGEANRHWDVTPSVEMMAGVLGGLAQSRIFVSDSATGERLGAENYRNGLIGGACTTLLLKPGIYFAFRLSGRVLWGMADADELGRFSINQWQWLALLDYRWGHRAIRLE